MDHRPVSPEHLQRFCELHQKCDLEYLSEHIPKAIDLCLEGVKRIAKIVKGFKEFSHPGSEEKRAINLNQAIETTISVARHEWKYCADWSLHSTSTCLSSRAWLENSTR